VAHILNYLEEAGTIFLVMEYIKGDTLEKRLATRGSLPQYEAVSVCQDVLTALGFMHAQGILHRDIKPGNIMVTDTGVVKVTDFGIAKVAGAKGQTQTGMRIGTLWYMAPEQLQGRAASVASDLYALGVTLYEMATGQLPFQGDSEYTVMKGHVEDAPEPPWLINPRVSQAWGHVILKALAKQPEQRYRSAQDFAAALAPLSQASPVSTARTLPPAPLQCSRSRTGRGTPGQQPTKARWLWTALALLVGLGSLPIGQHTLENLPDSRPRQLSMNALPAVPPHAPAEPSRREEQDANGRDAPTDETEVVQWYRTAVDEEHVAEQQSLRPLEPPQAECPADEFVTLAEQDESDLAKRQMAAIQEYEEAYKTLALEYQEALSALAPAPTFRLQAPQTTSSAPPPEFSKGAAKPPQPPSVPQNARRAGATSPEPGTKRRASLPIIPKPPRTPQPWAIEK
jgi:serine/threonine protein kinase